MNIDCSLLKILLRGFARNFCEFSINQLYICQTVPRGLSNWQKLLRWARTTSVIRCLPGAGENLVKSECHFESNSRTARGRLNKDGIHCGDQCSTAGNVFFQVDFLSNSSNSDARSFPKISY